MAQKEGRSSEGVMNIGIRGEPTKGVCGYYRGNMMNTGENVHRENRKGRQNKAFCLARISH